MIKKINFKNYKAFDSGEIELKPITLLLGANSVGKSAILQLFLMLQQTSKVSWKNYKSALKLYGGLINLGDVDNLFKNKNTNKDFVLKFEIKDEAIKEELKSGIFERFLTRFIEIGHAIPFLKKKKNFLNFFPSEDSTEELTSIEKIKEKLFFEDYLKKLISAIDVLRKNKKNHKEFLIISKYYRMSMWRGLFSFENLVDENVDEIMLTFELLKKLSELIVSDSFQLEYQFSAYEDKIHVKRIVLWHDSIKIIQLSSSNFKGKDYKLNFETILFDKKNLNKKILLKLKPIFIPDNILFSALSIQNTNNKENSYALLPYTIFRIFDQFQKYLQKTFSSDKINYVSPLRAHPQRYYMLDKAKMNISLDTLDGDALAEILKENSDVRKKVNEWLEKFGLNVQVENFKEVIHKLKIKQNNLSLDITDVGFGISQILPVVIQGFLSKEDSLTIIEQPEIHLHPKMQADLADLFIDIIGQESQKYLLIETHSEYFLKRLRRRIAEKKISYKDVKIYLLHPMEDGSGSFIESLNIEKGGAFKYPKDYYSGELLKDSTEFMKIQLKK